MIEYANKDDFVSTDIVSIKVELKVNFSKYLIIISFLFNDTETVNIRVKKI